MPFAEMLLYRRDLRRMLRAQIQPRQRQFVGARTYRFAPIGASDCVETFCLSKQLLVSS